MRIGVPKELKNHEYRVGATPALVQAWVEAGHRVLIERNAGLKIGFTDQDYEKHGAVIASQKDIWEADMVVKVKEPQKEEFSLMKEGQILFCYFHLAPDPEQTAELLAKKVICIAYETVADKEGRLPLLTPMSEVAGRLSIQVGANLLQLNEGGKGILLGGVTGVRKGKVVIIGGGVVGTEAARMALGLGAEVTLLDRSLTRLQELDLFFGPQLNCVFSSSESLATVVPAADLLIGAVHSAGKKTSKILSRALISRMENGSVFVDVAIDQGGCSETSRPTSHDDPIYSEEGVIHYCVTNMPGACARTATEALVNATTYYALKLADLGWKQAVKDIPALAEGLNICKGHVTNKAVAEEQGLIYTDFHKLVE